MSDLKTNSIDDDFGKAHKYTLALHPAGDGFNLLPRILKIAGGPLANAVSALDGVDGGLANAKVDGKALGDAITALAVEIIAEGSAAFLREILEHAIRDDQKVVQGFDSIYQGNYGELLAAVVWGLKENFGPFLRRHLDAGLSQIAARLPGAFSA